ncbi:hypothetical protein ACIQ9R_37460 [Streptomyces sp. NPDC094447]|uniref:hypothetical protein n=1 Tax=Streptomyces sp. NPDC094447 TaxID=3366062 RepID=UPI00381DAA14
MARLLPPGTPVAYHPGDGHLPESHWLGIVVEHHLNDDGSPIGLTDVECTDPKRFLNNWPGCVTTCETRKLRPLPTPASEPEPEPTLFDLA